MSLKRILYTMPLLLVLVASCRADNNADFINVSIYHSGPKLFRQSCA